MNAISRRARKLWQQFGTRLPCDHAPFDELFPANTPLTAGIHQPCSAFTGVLHEAPGATFTLEPTRYADGRAGTLAGEDRKFVAAEPQRRLLALANAGVCTPAGIVYDPATRCIVQETLEDWSSSLDDHAIFRTPGFPKAEPLPGASFLLSSLGGQTFYHFLIENLPKLALLAEVAPHVDQVVVARYGETWKTRWLAAAGWTGKIVWLQDLSHFRCDQLLFTNRLVRHYEPNPWAVATLRRLLPAGHAGANPPAILWLDRQSTPTRQVLWEHEISAGVPGAVRADFSTLTPEAGIDVCANVRALVGLHGAAFANMIFCPPGTKIVELMTEAFHPWYARLAQVCGHRHLAVRIDGSPASRAAAVAAINHFLQSP